MKFRVLRAARGGKSTRRKSNVFKFRRSAHEMERFRAIAQCSAWGDFYQFIVAALFRYAKAQEAILGLSAADALKLDRAGRLAMHRRQRQIGMCLVNAGLLWPERS